MEISKMDWSFAAEPEDTFGYIFPATLHDRKNGEQAEQYGEKIPEVPRALQS